MDLHLIPTFGLSEDLLFLLVFAVFGLIKFISSRSKKDENSAGIPEVSDTEQARRTREIQAEIRRRIAERNTQQPYSPAAPVSPAPASYPHPVAQQPQMHQEQVRRPDAVRRDRAAETTRNVDLMARLVEAQKEEAESRKRSAEAIANIRHKRVAAQEARVVQPAGDVVSMLRNPDGLRDAFILSEILTQPVSERSGGSCAGMR